jgi:YggT family protein
MCSVVRILDLMLDIYGWILIIYVVVGLLMAFGVVNPYNRFVNTVYQGLHAITEPVLRPIRKFLVRIFGGTGAMDFSPIVVFLILIFLRMLLAEYAYPAACIA